jgi:hypothetical protein
MNKAIAIFLLMTGLFVGCAGSAEKAAYIRQYVPEYPTPRCAGIPAVEALLRVERFSADRSFQGRVMLYRRGPFQREAYSAERWRINPADIVSEYLRRDLRAAGIFQAVLDGRDDDEVRYALMGNVEEFFEGREASVRKALLSATITLLDLGGTRKGPPVVFQKTYRLEATIAAEGATGLAAGMSLAMGDLSRQVIADIAAAVVRKSADP